MDRIEGVVFPKEHGGGVGTGAGFDKVCPFVVAIRSGYEELMSRAEAGAAVGRDAGGGGVGIQGQSAEDGGVDGW